VLKLLRPLYAVCSSFEEVVPNVCLLSSQKRLAPRLDKMVGHSGFGKSFEMTTPRAIGMLRRGHFLSSSHEIVQTWGSTVYDNGAEGRRGRRANGGTESIRYQSLQSSRCCQGPCWR
jgi:hypothetical protein